MIAQVCVRKQSIQIEYFSCQHFTAQVVGFEGRKVNRKNTCDMVLCRCSEDIMRNTISYFGLKGQTSKYHIVCFTVDYTK